MAKKVEIPTQITTEIRNLIVDCHSAFEDGLCTWPDDMYLALVNHHAGLPEPDFLVEFRSYAQRTVDCEVKTLSEEST